MAEPGGRVEDGIANERRRTAFLKNRADFIIDTSQLLTRELKAEMNRIFMQGKSYKNLYVSVVSFGFKYGIPTDADLVFDVRFLPNPFYDPTLRDLTGNNKEVYDFVINARETQTFLGYLKSTMDYVFDSYNKQHKSHMIVAIGCTGGQHRSVSVCNWLYDHYKKNYRCFKSHRDIGGEEE
jgi:UPF0042 nucleotide-binding protein